MFLDKLLEFDPSGTNITVTAASTNVLDMLNARDIGRGDTDLDILVIVQTTFTAAGAATLTTSLQSADDDGTGNPSTYYDQILTGAIPVANLTAQRELLKAQVPIDSSAVSNNNTLPRFYRIYYTVATGPMTAGKVGAWIIDHEGRAANYTYPSGFAVAN